MLYLRVFFYIKKAPLTINFIAQSLEGRQQGAPFSSLLTSINKSHITLQPFNLKFFSFFLP